MTGELTARWRALRSAASSAPMQIALTTAVRATLSTVLPLALLPRLGLAAVTYPAVLGALATSLVDVGGPYRTRLLVMLAQALLGPGLLLLGGKVVGLWWVAAALVAAIGIGSGLIRAAGQSAGSLGINMAVALLVGIQLGEFGRTDETLWALGYGGGGLWTILVALGFWELRPYRRLEQEVAAVWDAVAVLLEATLPAGDADNAGRERRLVAAHRAVRAALEQSSESLGDLQASRAGDGTVIAQLVALLESATAVAASGVTLCELAIKADIRSASELRLARACRLIARALLRARELPSLRALREPLIATEPQTPDVQASLERVACAQAQQHLQEAERALHALLTLPSSLSDLIRLPVTHRRPRGAVLNALRAHATAQSPIFRHAIRVSAVGALGTALVVALRLPHGIWLPVTALAILQPEYGGTVARAVQRSLGTVAGALIASVLLATVHASVPYDAALALLLFTTFLLIRRNYGYGIAFLTPLVILLIGMVSDNPWVDLAERVGYTIGGALLALAAGYLLWPQWERDQLRDRLVRAIDADKAYLDAVLQSLSDAGVASERLTVLRRQAEMALSNADAGLQRLLLEPAQPRSLFSLGLAVSIYLHRLCRHAIALSAQCCVAPEERAALARLRFLVAEVLDDVRRVIGEGRPPVPWPSIGARLSELVAPLAAAARENATEVRAAMLLGYVTGDLTGLLSAAGYEGA